MNRSSLVSQRGATLVIAMIMLVLLTLFVVASINMTSLNLRIMGNTQVRNEAIAAAQQAIEQVASTDFPSNPQAAVVNVDVTGDGTADYTATVAAPTCLNVVPIKMPVPGAAYNELDGASVDDQPCFGSLGVSNAGVVGGASGAGNSACENTLWDVSAAVADNAKAGSDVTVHQGISRRIEVGKAKCN